MFFYSENRIHLIAGIGIAVDVADIGFGNILAFEPCHKNLRFKHVFAIVNSLLRNLFLMFGNRLIFIPIALLLYVHSVFHSRVFFFCFKT